MADNIKRVLQRNLGLALTRGELALAAEVLEQLKLEDPLSVETRALELELHVRGRRIDTARVLARQLVADHPASPRLLFLAGQTAYQERAYVQAEAHFRESLRAHPHWHTRWWLGRTLTQLGRLDEAEAILVSLVEDHPQCGRDLAWLYERRGDPVRAQRFLDAYLADHPDDGVAREQRLRLRVQAMPADEIVAEVEALLDLGEIVSGEMFAGYIEALFAVGAPEVARRRVAERLRSLDVYEAKRLGWTTHRLGAYDLAYSLFVAALPAAPTT